MRITDHQKISNASQNSTTNLQIFQRKLIKPVGEGGDLRGEGD